MLTDPVPGVCWTAITHVCSFSSVSISIIMNMDPCFHAQGGPVRRWPTATFHILPGMSVNAPLRQLMLTICGTWQVFLACFIGYFKLGDSYSNDQTVMCTHLCRYVCMCVSVQKQLSLSSFFFNTGNQQTQVIVWIILQVLIHMMDRLAPFDRSL